MTFLPGGRALLTSLLPVTSFFLSALPHAGRSFHIQILFHPAFSPSDAQVPSDSPIICSRFRFFLRFVFRRRVHSPFLPIPRSRYTLTSPSPLAAQAGRRTHIYLISSRCSILSLVPFFSFPLDCSALRHLLPSFYFLYTLGNGHVGKMDNSLLLVLLFCASFPFPPSIF